MKHTCAVAVGLAWACVRAHTSGVSAKLPREIAARLLRQWEGGRERADALLADALPTLPRRDRSLCQELVLGVIRWRAPLDWLIEQKTDGRRQPPAARLVLRLGLYQLFWLDRVPAHAAVDTAVQLARRLDLGRAAGFINAVLRACQRERDALRDALQRLKTDDPALGHSHPAWLVRRWIARWGADAAGRLLAWNNQPAPIHGRANTLRADAAVLTARWRDEGVEHEPLEFPWTESVPIFRLQPPGSIADLPSFRDGLFYVQDASTLLAVHLLNPQPGEEVLDLCAAPGGKATLIAQRIGGEGTVIACDAQPRRLERLRENLARLGANCVEARPVAALGGQQMFDRVLADVPCSNTGVLRRRVDRRWRLRAEDLPPLVRQQADLLARAARCVRRGGVLVYSTCSLETEENVEVVAAFLQKHRAFELETARALTPFADGVDGAYVARMRRTA